MMWHQLVVVGCGLNSRGPRKTVVKGWFARCCHRGESAAEFWWTENAGLWYYMRALRN